VSGSNPRHLNGRGRRTHAFVNGAARVFEPIGVGLRTVKSQASVGRTAADMGEESVDRSVFGEGELKPQPER
jgi:hypothetical protein